MKTGFDLRVRHVILTALVLLSGLVSLPGARADACGQNGICQIGDRSYHVLPPDNWDGISALPVLLHFHGWGRQGNVPVKHEHVGAATRTRGVLLIAPDGLGKSWSFWRAGSRDTEFAKAVLEDTARHFPIDQSRIYVSGYSWGGSMAWRFACEAGNEVSVLLSISGTLYDQDETCETGPVEMRHVHGLKDTVMDYPYGPNLNESGAVRLWTRTNGCQLPAVSTWSTTQEFTRHEWADCDSKKPVTLDVHAGGHWIAKGWLAKQLDQLLQPSGN